MTSNIHNLVGLLVKRLGVSPGAGVRRAVSTVPGRNRFPMAGIKAEDPLQEASMEEKCILVNNDDQIIGSASKRACHLVNPDGSLLLHRAFSVFAFNSAGQLLLQKRSQFKVTFPNLWANTCCSHPLHRPQELSGELGARVAAQRRLGLELGVPAEVAAPENIHYLTRVHYEASSPQANPLIEGPVWGEHEIDYILFLKGLEENHVLPNQNEVAETRFVSRSELSDFLSEHKNQLTPWFSLIAHTFLPLWWDQLSDLNSLKDIEDTIHKF